MADSMQSLEEQIRRDAILEAIAFAAQRFLESSRWQDAIDEALARLGRATDASRTYVFTNRTRDDGALLTEMLYEWCAPGVSVQLDNPAMHDQPWVESGFGRWAKTLAGGEPVHGPVRSFPEAERSELQAQQIKSMLAVPVFVSGEWWGQVGFDDCRTEREWLPGEIDTLRAAAGILGGVIQRQEAEEGLRRAATELGIMDERYRLLVEKNPVVTYQQRNYPDGRVDILYIGPQIEDLTGYPIEKWSKDDFWFKVIHPGDVDRVRAEDARVVATNDPFSIDYRLIAADGRTIWVHEESIATPDPEGLTPMVWLGFVLDITERKETEERLAQAEARFRLLVENSPIVTYQESATQRDPILVYYLSPHVESLLGYPADRWSDTAFWRTVVHPDDRDAVFSEEDRTIQTGDKFEMEYRAIAADGSIKWIRDEAVLTRDDNGDPWIWQGFMLDITERRLAEEQLRDVEERYKALVELSPAVTYQGFVGEHGEVEILYLGPQIEQWLGYELERWEDPDFWNATVHPDDRGAVQTEDERCAGGLPFSLDYRLVAKDGRAVWVHDEAVLIEDPAGGRAAWHGILTDITERKHADEQLKRALEIERQSAEQLRELDEMKNTFLQAVSHDLRTPLTAILGLALTLERGGYEGEPAEIRDTSARIARNAKKLDKLVTDMLDLDRITRGITEMTRYPVDLARLAQSVAESADSLEGRTVFMETEPVIVEVDAAKVERIVDNLVNNAIRHTPRSAKIWIRVQPFEGGGLIAVEDDGPGVPKKERDAIFDAFKRGSDSATHSPGMGIGLSLVQRFAEMHGGRAWVEERTGGGASFRVFLPAG